MFKFNYIDNLHKDMCLKMLVTKEQLITSTKIDIDVFRQNQIWQECMNKLRLKLPNGIFEEYKAEYGHLYKDGGIELNVSITDKEEPVLEESYNMNMIEIKSVFDVQETVSFMFPNYEEVVLWRLKW